MGRAKRNPSNSRGQDDGFRKNSTHPTGCHWAGHPETLTNAILIALAGPMKTPLQPSELHKGPIRRPVLPESYVDRIKAFKAILSNVDPTSLKTMIDNFKRYSQTEEDIAIWERIANTYQLFLSRNPISDPAIRKEVFAV